MLKEERENPITRIVGRLEIPCYFVMGKYDYMTSVRAARAYFETLEAPEKAFVLFEQSAHYPQFEETERFAEWLGETWERLSSTLTA
ncbi:alpha/beta fold hydrolase [Cohnella sp.]|uniref:alpha/beta fold hydrolase n=1 Tax=Cohnella sp. TaxID=1883426 RepID=UPI003565BEE0